jgi:hypothetical protein
MAISEPIELTKCRRFFAEPGSPRQRQYEALRAFFLEGHASAEVARRFGYTPAAFRMLCYDFRRGQLQNFFAATRPGPREQPKKTKARDGAPIYLLCSPQASSANPLRYRGGTACLFDWSNSAASTVRSIPLRGNPG